MRPQVINTTKFRRMAPEPETDLTSALERRLVGQPAATSTILPYVRLFQAGLAPEGRPAGVFLLLGPTGTGKTRTVEALADVLHGSPRSLLKVDCGEYQMEHEVAKLIGAPPGYLGHRETQPVLTQQRLNAAASDRSPLSLVLFDEVEKAAASMSRLLLGVLDKGVLRLGDNSMVNFERSLIFLTSNLGARGMMRELTGGFGFRGMLPADSRPARRRLEAIALGAMRRRFSPEFVNRLDAVITYDPLDRGGLDRILDLEIEALESHLERRLDDRAFRVALTPGARAFLLEHGTSLEYGARELRRTMQKHLLQPLAGYIISGRHDGEAAVRVRLNPAGDGLMLSGARDEEPCAA